MTDVASPASSRVARRRDRRKQQIVGSAVRLLAEHGYQGVSVEAVAEECDIAKATLYHYFSSKDELVGEALESVTLDVLRRLSARSEAAGPGAVDRLRALIDEQILILVEDTPEVAPIFAWPAGWPEQFAEPLKTMRRRHNALFRAVIEDGLADGELDCADVDVALHCLHGILNQTAVWLPGDADRAAGRAATTACALRLFTSM
ncbi:TetR/AcrR family transcriptional regulator [Nocardioides dubius]|uniref:TetR/AcrR family transcriptional regulator n=1 Tax=Nocardioides dubius TaxID=317019 RepID=A0ABN1TZ63_9ACTN